jgi:hypothetical protein
LLKLLGAACLWSLLTVLARANVVRLRSSRAERSTTTMAAPLRCGAEEQGTLLRIEGSTLFSASLSSRGSAPEYYIGWVPGTQQEDGYPVRSQTET